MTETAKSASPAPTLATAIAAPLIFTAVVVFQLAYSFAACRFIIVIYLYCLFQLARVGGSRFAFYCGLAVGLLSYGPQLTFFWTIFGPAAIALWCILAVWVALFVLIARLCLLKFGKVTTLLLIPFLWTGLEYFRSELYYLRFSWLNVGYVFAGNPSWLFKCLGVYGIGFIFMAVICLTAFLKWKPRLVIRVALFALLGIITNLPRAKEFPPVAKSKSVSVAGVQMEFPSETQIIDNLDGLIIKYPQAQLVLLSEYSVDGTVPDRIRGWCQKNQRYLVIGGKDPASGSQFYDTAFVVDQRGQIVFRQGKCVPVQFFKDGLPALEQKLWDSPWGKIGICICHDLSYTRVTDELTRLGAQALIVPSMDAIEWGRRQHEMHTRVARIRAAEYGIPVFRLASSGISQFVNSQGCELATAPMPGDGATIFGVLAFENAGSLPLDRVLAQISVPVCGVTVFVLVFVCVKKKASVHNKTDLT